MFADERRADGGGTPGRNDGGRDARIRGSPIGVLGGGNPRGSDRRGHDDRGGTRVGGRVVPGPRAPEREARRRREAPRGSPRASRRDSARERPSGTRRCSTRTSRGGARHASRPRRRFAFRRRARRAGRRLRLGGRIRTTPRVAAAAGAPGGRALDPRRRGRGADARWARAPSAENMARLDGELRRIVRQQRTTPRDDQKRQNLLARFSHMLDKKFPGVSCAPFGSYVSVFHTAGSDIDLSLEVDPNSPWYDAKEMGTAGNRGSRGGNRRHQPPRGFKSKKVQLLSKVAGELRYRGFAEVNLIAHARVPLIKLYDPETGVNCDVCVGNDGVYKSAVLGAFADLDERYRDLVFLVKMWAKQFDCNDALAAFQLVRVESDEPVPPANALAAHLTSGAAPDPPQRRRRGRGPRGGARARQRPRAGAQDAGEQNQAAVRRDARRGRGRGARGVAVARVRRGQHRHPRGAARDVLHALQVRGAALEARPGRVDLRRALGAPAAPGRPAATASGWRTRSRRGTTWRAPCSGARCPRCCPRCATARSPWRASAGRTRTRTSSARSTTCWAPARRRRAEMPQSGWPTLGGAGGNEPLNSPGGAGMSPGRPFGMDAFGGGAGGAPPGTPPPPPPRTDSTRGCSTCSRVASARPPG